MRFELYDNLTTKERLLIHYLNDYLTFSTECRQAIGMIVVLVANERKKN